jgi:predicted acylesterase/phospholipase RssA
MTPSTTLCWVLDSGGAGRGAWQGGVIHELMRWCREQGCYPQISMGASAGGYAAADVATETEATVLKGWTRWGREKYPRNQAAPREQMGFWGLGTFRLHLRSSIRYVMGDSEVAAVFNERPGKKLLIFTTRVRRRDGRPIRSRDLERYFLKSLTRKLPRALKYSPRLYEEVPVIFAAPLPMDLQTEFVRPLTRSNYHSVIEASCLVPLAMGWPLRPEQVGGGESRQFDGDAEAVFLDGSFAMKMPMALFAEDGRFRDLAGWVRADKTVVFSCDPKGRLWETSARLRLLNQERATQEALKRRKLLVIAPDHPVEAGFLCYDNAVIMRTFRRGQEQAERLLRSRVLQRFLA